MRSYRTKEAVRYLKGFGINDGDITQTQLIHWAERGPGKPSVKDADGHGSYREYDFRDLVKLALIARMVSVGKSLKGVTGYFNDVFENPSYFQRIGRPYHNLWEALKNEPETFGYFCIATWGGAEQMVVDEFFFSNKPFVTLLYKQIRDPAYKDSVVRRCRIANISEIVNVLSARTGDTL